MIRRVAAGEGTLQNHSEEGGNRWVTSTNV